MYRRGMVVLCPSCGYEPAVGGAPAGDPCPLCSNTLIFVEPPKDDLIGAIVDDRFEVLAQIGKGGMGRVYRARQRSIGREVALKVIDRAAENDVAAVKRFFREAQLASQLSHPNTVSIIEFGQHADGRLYLAMELVRGRTLFDVVREAGALPAARVARIGVQLCDALEAAHALSIIHRDLKLDNVMLVEGARDHIKVLDFGLARSLADPESRATLTGVIAGTPRYLAPEVVTHAAEPAPTQDVYALGVILGELAVGRELWKSPSIDALLAQKLEGKPDLDGAAPALRALIEAMIAVDLAARPTVADARTQLLAIEAARPEPAVAGAGAVVMVTEPSTTALQAEDLMESPSLVAAAAVGGAVKPPEIRESKLVGLGDVHAARSQPLPPVVAAPPVVPAGVELAEPIDDGDAPKLELETEWHAEKKAKAANPFPESVPPPVGGVVVASQPGVARAREVDESVGVGSILGVIVLFFLGIGGALGAMVWWQHHKMPVTDTVSGDQPGLGSAPHEVSIHVTGNADEVRVDGKLLGKPPVTLTHARDGQLLVVTGTFGGQTVTEHVVADGDHEVDLRAP
jgi:hypothetical protein